MNPLSAKERIAKALAVSRPEDGLIALAKDFKNEGMSQVAIREAYLEFFRAHSSDKDETKYDALFETLTVIDGECGPGARLFP